MNAEITPLVRVTHARVLGRYIVELTFADGAVKVIDLEPHLWGEMFAPMRADYEAFRRLRVDEQAGTIVWPNGADLSPRMLYAKSKSRIPA